MTRLRPGYVAAAMPILAAAAIAVGASPPSGGDAAPTPVAATVDANAQLRCTAADDAAGIDAILTAAGSPLAGDGQTFVDTAKAAGIDPRFVVAVAAHETMLMTYGPAQRINNPFGLGPGMSFADHKDAVAYASRLLGKHYVGEGRTTIPLIGSKWAPLGVANDPQNLNSHWAAGVSRYYATLGGDPHQPVTLARQAGSTCAGGATQAEVTEPAAPTAPLAKGSGTPQVVVWNGAPPTVSGTTAAVGADPVTGSPAGIPGFVFPLAVPADGQVRYTADPCAADTSCATPLASASMAHVVASTDGTLVGATAEEQRTGVGFWITRTDGDRIGYGPLASYAPGIQDGAVVTAGQPLGRSTGAVSFSWQRNGAAINPRPLLSATRPSAP